MERHGIPFAISKDIVFPETQVRRRPPFAGALAAIGSLGALAAGLAFMDERVRGHLARLIASGASPSGELATVGDRVQDFLYIAVQAARDQSIEHAPLVIFGLAALVLVLFMTRT